METQNATKDFILHNFEKYTNLLIAKDTEKAEKIEKWINEYDNVHEILQREDKIIGKGQKQTIVKTAKLIIPQQRKIVEAAVAFLLGSDVNLQLANNEEKYIEAYKKFTKLWKDSKLYYHSKRLARRLFIETEVAELFYIHPKTKKVKAVLLCRENNDEIYPVWDEYGDMTAFLRMYKITRNSKTYEYRDVYTVDMNYFGQKVDGVWKVKPETNLIKKIPVIYYNQKEAEWESVQSIIDRTEMLISKNADTNDYFGSPAVKVKGEVASAPTKEEVGKLFVLKPVMNEGRVEYGDVDYMTWDRAPEGVKVEYEMLKDIIYSQTSTPDLSFNNVKGIGNVSGVVLQFMFFDSILKARVKEELFGEMFDRRNNIIKAILAVLDTKNESLYTEMEINVTFENALPSNLKETIENLALATGGEPIMSQRTAVKLNPLVENPEEELENLEEEKEEPELLNQSFQ